MQLLTAALSDSPSCWPDSVDNWHAFENRNPWLGTTEYPLFTDAWIVGEIKLGPYAFLNARATQTAGPVRPGIILRYEIHKHSPYPNLKKTDETHYHGAHRQEELAALASLALGIRLRAGTATRIFEPGGDPLGTPDYFGRASTPQLDTGYFQILPDAFGRRNLDALSVIRHMVAVDSGKAFAIVRAARLYQDALWLAESVPEFAWLLLVSALEAGAGEWQKDRGDSSTRLAYSKPDLYSFLQNLPDTAILPQVAAYLADSLGLTKKFVDFVMKFLPDPPASRAPDGYCFPWVEMDLRKALRAIYNYRSRALHQGTPFPRPMSHPPHKDASWGGYSEIMTSIASGESGGSWLKKDIPMNLHLFEYIARNVLLNWLRA